MSEMVDRVAKVFADAGLGGCETTVDDGDLVACVGKCACRDAARAVIVAMREPTDAMVRAAYNAPLDIYWNYGAKGPGGADDVWRAMIDGAA